MPPSQRGNAGMAAGFMRTACHPYAGLPDNRSVAILDGRIVAWMAAFSPGWLHSFRAGLLGMARIVLLALHIAGAFRFGAA